MNHFNSKEIVRTINLGLAPSRKVALLGYVLDRSGSMSDHQQRPREELNTLIRTASGSPGAENAFYVVASFADGVSLDVAPTRLTEARFLESYRADGSTALFMASHNVISVGLEFMQHARRAGYEPIVDITVLSDGDNTIHDEYQSQALASASRGRNAGMKLSVVGIGISGERLAQVLGFDPNYAQTVAATQAGVTEAMHATTVRTGQTLSHTLVGDVLDQAGHTILPGHNGRHR